MTARAEVQPSQGGMRNAAARRKEQDIDGGVDCAGSNTAVWSSRARALLVPTGSGECYVSVNVFFRRPNFLSPLSP
jgi:hypothetical protein